MKGRAQAILLCSSQANANTVRDTLANWIGGRSGRWTVEGYDPVAELKLGQWRVRLDVCFDTRLSADQVKDEIVSRWTSGGLANRILAGSWVGVHSCRHDEGVAEPCVWDFEVVK